MAVRVILYRVGLFSVLREIQYSLAQMSLEPLAAPYVPTFQGLHTKWKTVLHTEIDILDDLAQAQAAVDRADQGLDAFAGRVAHAIDESTDGKTQKQLKSALFKGKALSRFRRPVLGRQLLSMADWSDTLSKCGVPALAALAPEADKLVTAGQKADKLRADAQKKNRDFRDVGARKQFIDELNGARKEAHGGLGKLPFQNPSLPQDFADGFFSTEPPRDEEETIDEVKTSIEELTAQLEERKALLQKLEDEAAAAAKADEERKAQEAQADDLEAQAEALLKQAAALKAKLKK